MKDWKEFSVAELVPHAGSMMLLERVIDYTPDQMIAEAIVRNDGLFGDGGKIPAWMGIEYMAQTVAALGGMNRRLVGKSINLGFLLGTRRYDCNVDSFAVGAVLTVHVKKLIQDQGLGVFDCYITAEGIKASAKLNVYQPDTRLNRVVTLPD